MKYKTSRHHRRCRFRQGSSDVSNISIVPDDWHRNWHILFGHKDTYEIAKDLQVHWLKNYQFVVRHHECITYIRDSFFDWATQKQNDAWEHLFGGKSVERVLLEINSIWIDPEYLIKRRVGI